jgi:hypothetical protein
MKEVRTHHHGSSGRRRSAERHPAPGLPPDTDTDQSPPLTLPTPASLRFAPLPLLLLAPLSAGCPNAPSSCPPSPLSLLNHASLRSAPLPLQLVAPLSLGSPYTLNQGNLRHLLYRLRLRFAPTPAGRANLPWLSQAFQPGQHSPRRPATRASLPPPTCWSRHSPLAAPHASKKIVAPHSTDPRFAPLPHDLLPPLSPGCTSTPN